MFLHYHVDLNEKDYEKRINALGLNMKTTARQMTASVATAIRRDSRRKVRAQSKKSGELAKLIGYKANNDFSFEVYAKKFYASFLENGVPLITTRNPKKKKYLVFKIDGEIKKVKSVTIEPRPFLKPIIDEYFGSGKAEKIMEEALQKALDKKMGKEE